MAFASGRDEKARCQGKANLNGKLAALGLAPKGTLAAVGVAWQQRKCSRYPTELLQSIQLNFATATRTLSHDNCYRALRATATEHGYIG